MIDASLKDSPAIAAFLAALAEGHDLVVEEVWDVPKALLASVAAHKRQVLLVTGGTRTEKLLDDLELFAPKRALQLPSWETLPGEEIAPSADLIGKRFATLEALKEKSAQIVVAPLSALLQKMAPLDALSLTRWRKGEQVAFSRVPELLSSLGYRRVAVVADKGEFAVRGGIVDLFAAASPLPVRIDFFGDEIDEIRTFDPGSQKSVGKVESVLLSPVDELALLKTSGQLVSLITLLDEPILLFDDLEAIEEAWVSIQKMPAAQSPFSLSLSALLREAAGCLKIFCTSKPLHALSARVATQAKSRYFQQVAFEAFGQTLEGHRFFHPFRSIHASCTEPGPPPDAPLFETFSPPEGCRLVFLNATETEEQEVQRRLAAVQLPPHAHFERGYLSSGVCISDIPLALIPHAEFSGKTRLRREAWRGAAQTPAAEFHQLSPGDLVVHFHSGIGRYLGIEKQKSHLGTETEFLAIEYADKSKLFVPLSQAYLVSRYIGASEEAPSLSQLGSKRWQTVRQNAQAQIVGYAHDLLQLYAARTVAQTDPIAPDGEIYQAFCKEFPYAETHDQLQAIEAAKNDLFAGKPMDRLVCGDVGYGKTEVAMRIACKVVADGGKQVAVLVPTTVLAMQHFDTFSDRFKGLPVKIGVVSRFLKAKENKKTLEAAQQGQLDILIGTHRLLSEDVHFQRLGLIIVDEEQRFGVRAKEHLKKWKASVHALTLSATPIPRTLYMSLVSARDMSVINTPPQDRLPVKTILAEGDETLIQNALMRELARGGQAFYIHNRVESIGTRADALQKLVPQARIGIVHGQMDPEEADPVFHAFRAGKIDLLLSTTIIENGIDVPNANTILIERADTYGLADLYQLRGRVGRWNRAAYAYFLIPKHVRLSEQARKRLHALVEAGGYGGGMRIAMRDLEIRGAGDLLGVQQSGHVSSIGFHLYCKLLKRAVEALKKQKDISFDEVKLEFPFDARIPESYVDEVALRMELYYRFGEASDWKELDELMGELRDRFGEMPEQLFWLYHLSRLRAFASANQFTQLKLSGSTLHAEQRKGKEAIVRNILLPKKTLRPQELEAEVLQALKKNFDCLKSV
jgi:transcription-repair coupling factor (superfamily II helicase)